MTHLFFVLTLLLVAVYAGLSWCAFSRARQMNSRPRNRRHEHTLLGVILLVHACAVLAPVIGETAFSFSLGLGRAVAVLAWLMLFIYWACRFFYRVEGLQVFMMPLAMLTLAFSLVFPGSHKLYGFSNPAFVLHVLASMLAYCLFSLGALFAILMLGMDRALHNKHRIPLVRQVPSLLELEQTMFHVLGIGFVLLTLSLLTGVVFSDHVFGKPAVLTHKTVFSVMAWVLFAALLWGRQRYGWRGRVASRWTLIGFALLFLAYLGSKTVLELILRRL